MGWDELKLEKNQSEIECLKDYLVGKDTKYVAHSYDRKKGIYYFALKENGIITCTVVSMNSYKGEREEGYIYLKIIPEAIGPIYIKPSKKVFNSLSKKVPSFTSFNYSWRKMVKEAKWFKKIKYKFRSNVIKNRKQQIIAVIDDFGNVWDMPIINNKRNITKDGNRVGKRKLKLFLKNADI